MGNLRIESINLLLTYDKFEGSTTVGHFAYAGREGGNFDSSTMMGAVMWSVFIFDNFLL